MFTFDTIHDQFLSLSCLLTDTQSGVLLAFKNTLWRIYSLALLNIYSSPFDWPDSFGSWHEMPAWPPAYLLYIPYRCTYCLYISNVSKCTVARLVGANFSTNVTAQKSAFTCTITCIHIPTLGLG